MGRLRRGHGEWKGSGANPKSVAAFFGPSGHEAGSAFLTGQPVILEHKRHPFGGDIALFIGIGLGGFEAQADFLDAHFDGAREADLREHELRGFFVEFVGDDHVLAGVDEFSGEQREPAGGEGSRDDVNPGAAGFGGEMEPEGVVEVDAGVLAAVGAGPEGLGVETGDELLHAIDFVARESDVEHGVPPGKGIRDLPEERSNRNGGWANGGRCFVRGSARLLIPDVR